MFQRNILPQSSRSKSKPSKKPAEVGSRLILAYYLTLNLEEMSFFETQGSLETIQCYNPEDHTVHSHPCKNLRSSIQTYYSD
jgi:hypothetical protein